MTTSQIKTKPTQNKNYPGYIRPSVYQEEDKLSGGQNQDKKPLHGFERLNLHILDIQSLLLVKAITVFNPERMRHSS
jgi:hypothetical protein